MSISNYHLFKFIVSNASNKPNWQKWFKFVSQIYKNNIPDQLLEALVERGEDDLKRLCKAEQERKQKKQDKYNQWIIRRDAGNQRARLEKLNKHEIDMQISGALIKELDERFVAQMMLE
jgi:hypothetical protein